LKLYLFVIIYVSIGASILFDYIRPEMQASVLSERSTRD
jgi:hypothetical protein